MRDALLTGWAVLAAEGLQRQAAITDGVDPRTKPLALGINSHFARSVLATLPEAFEEPETLDDLVWGFPGVGSLPALHIHTHALNPQGELLTRADLDATLQERNLLVLDRVKEQEFAEDIWSIHAEDERLGSIGSSVPLEELPLDSVRLRWRLIGREVRKKGWRSRTVDHHTEPGL